MRERAREGGEERSVSRLVTDLTPGTACGTFQKQARAGAVKERMEGNGRLGEGSRGTLEAPFNAAAAADHTHILQDTTGEAATSAQVHVWVLARHREACERLQWYVQRSVFFCNLLAVPSGSSCGLVRHM